MTNSNADKHTESTGFQEQAPYDESIDLRTDFVMVYGLNDTTPQRIARWSPLGSRNGAIASNTGMCTMWIVPRRMMPCRILKIN